VSFQCCNARGQRLKGAATATPARRLALAIRPQGRGQPSVRAWAAGRARPTRRGCAAMATPARRPVTIRATGARLASFQSRNAPGQRVNLAATATPACRRATATPAPGLGRRSETAAVAANARPTPREAAERTTPALRLVTLLAPGARLVSFRSVAAVVAPARRPELRVAARVPLVLHRPHRLRRMVASSFPDATARRRQRHNATAKLAYRPRWKSLVAPAFAGRTCRCRPDAACDSRH
jgi:hypothetical protein